MIAFGHIIYYGSPFQTSLPFPSLFLEEGQTQVYDHHINYGQNQNRGVSLSTDGTFLYNESKQKWAFEIKDLICFNWEEGSSTLYCTLQVNASLDLLQYWFLHTLLPIYLTIEGKYDFIHAGSVEINNQAVLFIAPSFGGKSTLTNYFIQEGHSMISDDRVGISYKAENIYCTSSYPYHRPYRKMEDLGLEVKNFVTKEKKLHVIYVLESVDAKDDISFTRLQGIESFKVLQYNFDFTLPLNKARSFELIAKIAVKTPIYKLCIPWNLDRLNEVYAKICQHSTQGIYS
ncbi:MAG: hypothetical protein COA44_06365 [Arcobacter sp.]|nr:MAG: hypothetical protein COA44_06365 [Arcobacter sp.]